MEIPLFIDGEHICSIQEERLSGLKYDGRYPEKSIDYVLDEIPKEEIRLSYICRYWITRVV